MALSHARTLCVLNQGNQTICSFGVLTLSMKRVGFAGATAATTASCGSNHMFPWRAYPFNSYNPFCSQERPSQPPPRVDQTICSLGVLTLTTLTTLSVRRSDRSNHRLVWIENDGTLIKTLDVVGSEPLPCNAQTSSNTSLGACSTMPSSCCCTMLPLHHSRLPERGFTLFLPETSSVCPASHGGNRVLTETLSP